MTPAETVARLVWIAIKLFLVLQFGLEAARFVYEGF
jgi:hypothetical protein